MLRERARGLVTITFHTFFNKFEKKAGMTGTALTEEKEFRENYRHGTLSRYYHRSVARIHHQDAVDKTKRKKNSKQLVEEVKTST